MKKIPSKFLDDLIKKCITDDDFYAKGWLLFFLLRGRIHLNNTVASNFFNVRSSPSSKALLGYSLLEENNVGRLYDSTMPVISNNAAINAYTYLWSREGQNVYLHNKDNNAARENVGILEAAMQKDVTEDSSLNYAIKETMKNGIDYGVGYTLEIKEKYHSVHPLRVVRGKGFYIIESEVKIDKNGDEYVDYIITGLADDAASVNNGLDTKGKYFLHRISGMKSKNDLEIKLALGSSTPFIHEFKPMNFESGSQSPCGAGLVALNAGINLQQITRAGVLAQASELRPPMLAAISLSDNYGLDLSAGSLNYYDPYERISTDPLRPATPARGTSASMFIDYWKNSVRNAYFPESVAARGVGQTTAAEAARVAQTASSFLSSMRSPFFNWYITPLLKGKLKRVAQKEELSETFNSVDFRFIGNYTGDVINDDLQHLRVLTEFVGSLSQLDPRVVNHIDAAQIMDRLLTDIYPSDVLMSPEAVAAANERVRMGQELQEEQSLMGGGGA
ncbi:putative head to tail connecting protein [Xenohaliotis phage pCXc-HC2016]|nr:putative head to tail connecting protein [Xenohaliotis phage pCXc-HC2016]AQW89127.1 putative head to tail connecting protein [Xenohaliotis phage pCXc-HR2015]